MSYSKNDVINIATKLGRLANGGVVGYYAGGKTSEIMREAIPEQLINVVERHKKLQLGASLAQSIVPGAGLVASAASVASLWKMYCDINQVLGIKISENAGKSITSAIITNFSSYAAKSLATLVSEGAKLIPFVGWIASAGISSVTSTAIVYGSAYLYMNALSIMYNAKGKFDLDYLTSEISNDTSLYSDYENHISDDIEDDFEDSQIDNGVEWEEYNDEEDDDEELQLDNFEHCLQAFVSDEYTNVDDYLEAVNDLINNQNISNPIRRRTRNRVTDMFDNISTNSELENLNLLAAVTCLNEIVINPYRCCYMRYISDYIESGCNYINEAKKLNSFSSEIKLVQYTLHALYDFCVNKNFSSLYYDEHYKKEADKIINNLQCNIFSEEYIKSLYENIFSFILYFCTPSGKEEFVCFDYEEEYDENVDDDEPQDSLSSLSEGELEYFNEYKEMLFDGEISERDRRYLNKIMKSNDISSERAIQIESMATSPKLSDAEQEYLDEYKEIIEEGEISSRDQRFLDKLKRMNGISEERAKEIEALVLK